MSDVSIGSGSLAGRGVYANRDFSKGEVVISYRLRLLSETDMECLPQSERQFTHTHGGYTYLYGEPERYMNYDSHPNTYCNVVLQVAVAARDIQEGEMITTDA